MMRATSAGGFVKYYSLEFTTGNEPKKRTQKNGAREYWRDS
jgi:hypothetical protein